MKLVVPVLIDDAALTSSSLPETDHAVWSSGTTYGLGERVIRLETHKIYESLGAGNIANIPENDSLTWAEVGPTNRWAMFDGVVGTASEDTADIVVVLNVPACNDIVLMGVTATFVSVDTSSGTVSGGVPSPLPPATTSTLYLTGLNHAGGALTITVSGSGAIGVGNVSLGTIASIGDSQFGGTGIGIVDYSRRDVDQFGTTTLTKRGYSKRINVKALLLSTDFDRVAAILTAVRSLPTMWIGGDGFASLFVWGFVKEWSVELTDAKISSATVSVESLVIDAATQPAAVVPTSDIALALSNRSISSGFDYTGFVGPVNPTTTAEAIFTLHTDGRAAFRTTADGSLTVSSGDYSGEWVVGGTISIDTAALYECSFAGGAWQSLTVDRSVMVAAAMGEDNTITPSVQIRRASTGAVLASATVTLRAFLTGYTP